MYLLSLETALPDCRLSQADSWEVFARSKCAGRLRPASRKLMERVMLGKSGIDFRHFAIEPEEALFEADAEQLNQAFEREAPRLGSRALKKSLTSAGIDAEELDALFVCTCTGYLCPGISSYISEQVKLRHNAYLQDIVGQGCGAAIPTLRSASNYIAAHPDHRVAVIAVEIASAAFFVDDDAGVIISAALFGDGAAASIWTGNHSTDSLRINDFDTIHMPDRRGILRFTNSKGKLRNILAPSVPAEAGVAVAQLFQQRTTPGEIEIAAHPGGREVLRALESSLPQAPHPAAYQVLRKYGNMSSPSVLFTLKEMLADGAPSHPIWLTSFGAGMSAHSASLHTNTHHS